jgi:hypothetical protein
MLFLLKKCKPSILESLKVVKMMIIESLIEASDS